MKESKMKEQSLHCSNVHHQKNKVSVVLLESQMQPNQRLICDICNEEENNHNTNMDQDNAQRMIQKIQNLNNEVLTQAFYTVKNNQAKILDLWSKIRQDVSLDQVLEFNICIENWILELEQVFYQDNTFSFQQDLEQFCKFFNYKNNSVNDAFIQLYQDKFLKNITQATQCQEKFVIHIKEIIKDQDLQRDIDFVVQKIHTFPYQFTSSNFLNVKEVQKEVENLLSLSCDYKEIIGKYRHPLIDFEKFIKEYEQKIMGSLKKIELMKEIQEIKQIEHIIASVYAQNKNKNCVLLEYMMILSKIYEIIVPVYLDILQKKNDLIEYLFKEDNNYDVQAIGFNFDGTLMIVGSFTLIYVLNFNKGLLEGIQKKLEANSGYIHCLSLSKTTNWFALGSDKGIELWKEVASSWVSSQSKEIQFWQKSVVCLVMNHREDQLVSGYKYLSLCVWAINYIDNSLIFQYQLMGHTGRILQISINKLETVLASCSEDQKIIIWGWDDSLKWKINEIIKQDKICGLTFLYNDILVFQELKGIINFYNFKTKQIVHLEYLTQDSEIEVNQFQTLNYNSQNELLIAKHKNQFFFLKKNFKGFYGPPSINLGSDSNFFIGQITQDGKFFVTWEEKNKQYKIYQIN